MLLPLISAKECDCIGWEMWFIAFHWSTHTYIHTQSNSLIMCTSKSCRQQVKALCIYYTNFIGKFLKSIYCELIY